jgi:hypothetical protein
LVDNRLQKGFTTDPGDVIAMYARHLPELKALLGHVEGKSSLVASPSGKGIGVEDLFDYLIRFSLCKLLRNIVFDPFHPQAELPQNDFVAAMYHDVQQRGISLSLGLKP